MDVGGVARRGQKERSAKHEAPQKPTMITAGLCRVSGYNEHKPAQMQARRVQRVQKSPKAQEAQFAANAGDGRASNF
ncbi:hypothetical protein PtrSN002B_001832 [Pyrenophora tritici-repentis]|uniref:Uncharacterized protein n=2 Tax=Pyrenophora tritici-repentis TaxID=45151 RepID=A0A2W1EVT8_9PLEO|nr:hypothetical protein PtrV1_12349 [Pyrenophora tritici-repentis]KAF7445151.1 hypothetical protein A1F99_101370 [Pyrenophora tritici-repentis]KAF7565418.1 hypothetical protein PtrM4_048520 [Pyrenophora tritici-repentis]KAG9380446.1 hypothetical protein A1F94_009341 [Pyrenophora tritici-repentis]KAI0581427.1 hypothetical protein Alg215_04693 [Pyrenophora tritici-repentis]